MADDDVEMVGEAPVAVEEERKISPEMEVTRLIFQFTQEADGTPTKDALKINIMETVEKNCRCLMNMKCVI